MFIIKIILISIWFIGGYVFFIYLPRPSQGASTSHEKVTTSKPTQSDSPRQRDTNVEKASTDEKPTHIIKQVVKEEKDEVVEAQEEKEEEVDFTNVEIFSKTLNLNLKFYESLSASMKEEFDRYYVLDHEHHLVKSLVYVPKGDNQAFFKYVFNHLYTYRKLMSSTLLSILTEELIHLAEGNPKIQTILYEIATRTAYFRRKDPAYLTLAEDYSTRDIVLHRTVFKSSNTYVYSYTRLAIILEKRKRFDEALTLVDEALRLTLSDKTVNGYEGRRVRILEKQRKAKIN
jgi:tetratricopeptide (TPR) repeat protein